MTRLVSAALVAFVGAAYPAAGQRRGAPSAAPNTPIVQAAGSNPNHGATEEYRIGASDVLRIGIQGEPDLSLEAATVRPDGKITVPLLHDVEVAGLTPALVQKEIAEGLAKYFVKPPVVTVGIAKTASKKIYVMGKVNAQGPRPYIAGITVMQALQMAGGLSAKAKPKGIYVIRSKAGEQVRLPFNYLGVSDGSHLERDFPLQAGDMVVVP